MLCDECGKQPASVHITKFENGRKTDIHLCVRCASPSFTITDLLTGFLNQGTVVPVKPDKAPELTCDLCGMTYSRFRATGRFGCSHCYQTFGERLNPLFKKVHGNILHTGKVPGKAGRKITVQREVEKLRKQLTEVIQQEEYEQAASIRDRIRQLMEMQKEGD